MGMIVLLGDCILQIFNSYGVNKFFYIILFYKEQKGTIPSGLNLCNKNTRHENESHRDSIFFHLLIKTVKDLSPDVQTYLLPIHQIRFV